MRTRKRRLATGALAAVVAVLVGVSAASAAFPNFTGCPRSTPGLTACVDIQSTRGSLDIKGFTVPLGDSLEIRGGVTGEFGEPQTFIPATGTNGFFSKPIEIPGGLLGIDFPIPGNAVRGTAQLAGPASSIVLSLGLPATVTLPVKLKLDNLILGPNCYIGSNSNPVRLVLTTGTTRPSPPNRPITGRIREIVSTEETLFFLGAESVDNAFAVPGASGCGLGLGLISALVNAKLRLPSAGGNNTMIVENNVALGLP